jgi:uncharacterized membrane protein
MAERDPETDKPRLDEHPGDGALRSTTRLEAFADAVLAIAFTLSVVELKLPAAGPGYLARLMDLWPSYLGFGLSALVIGIYWVNHHFSGAIYRTAGHWFLLATLLFLAAISFIAFPTRGFAENIRDADARADGGLFYTLALSGTALTWWIKWRVGVARGEIDRRLRREFVQRLDRKYDVSTLLMIAAIPLAFARWEAGLALAGAVTLSYLRPPETPEYWTESPPMDDPPAAGRPDRPGLTNLSTQRNIMGTNESIVTDAHRVRPPRSASHRAACRATRAARGCPCRTRAGNGVRAGGAR